MSSEAVADMRPDFDEIERHLSNLGRTGSVDEQNAARGFFWNAILIGWRDHWMSIATRNIARAMDRTGVDRPIVVFVGASHAPGILIRLRFALAKERLKPELEEGVEFRSRRVLLFDPDLDPPFELHDGAPWVASSFAAHAGTDARFFIPSLLAPGDPPRE